jgi:hypothetical protein
MTATDPRRTFAGRVLATLCVLLAALLAGCSPPVESGLVTQKTLEPGEAVVVPECARFNRRGECRSSRPDVYYQPARWRLDLRDENGREGSVYVDSGTYDFYQVGDRYPAE